MTNLKKERYSVNVRVSSQEMEKIKTESTKEMISASAYVRRQLFLTPKTAV